MSKTKTTTYEQAIEELEQIVRDLEKMEVPVDQLEEKAKRAKDLLEYCQKRLRKIEDATQSSDAANED
jgi:exodeoxyribonuclease VII small subunit